MSLNYLRKFLHCSSTSLAKLQFVARPGVSSARAFSASCYSVGFQQNTLRSSRWYMCANKQLTGVTSSHSGPCSARCGCAQLHTAGDKEVLEFLGKEIKYEKDRQHATPKNLKGFEISSSNGAEVVLKKKQQNETIVIRLNVNNSVDDENAQALEEEPSKEQKEQEPKMISKPAFVVELSKGGDTKLAIHCVFPAADVEAHAEEDGEHYADLIAIEEVALLNKDQEWDEKTYMLPGSMMDGTLYDMLLNLLEERGIDGEFVEQLITFATSYEHGRYVSFLEQLKDFVGAK